MKRKNVSAGRKDLPKTETDLLERLLKEYSTDEMGLLDLVFIDEILSQKLDEKVR